MFSFHGFYLFQFRIYFPRIITEGDGYVTKRDQYRDENLGKRDE